MQRSSTGGARGVWLAGSLLILAVSALAYLPLARRFGFVGDDWYLVYSGLAGGFDQFHQVFAIDRPFRAYFVGGVFELFGLNAPLYSYFSYLLRAAGAFAMLWLLRLVWPRLGRAAAALALMFAVYPGWMDQPAAYDYQSHLLSFALMIVSLALSVLAFDLSGARRAAATVLGVICQILSLLLMEYYIGLEGLRLLLILYLTAGRSLGEMLPGRGEIRCWLARVLPAWLPYLLGAAAFLFWRSVLFESERAATDIGGMLAGLIADPAYRGLWLLVHLVQDAVSSAVLAWFVPVYQTAFDLRLRDALTAVGLGLLAALVTGLALAWMRSRTSESAAGPRVEQGAARPSGADLLVLGGLGLILALVPVALGDRHIVFPAFSRFSLPASVGAVLLLGGILEAAGAWKGRAWGGIAAAAVLVGLAVMGHHGNSAAYAQAWEGMRQFWWQASWRAPGIAPETVLAAQYPSSAVVEDYFVWGPANLVYYPAAQRGERGLLRTPLAALVLTPENVQAVELGRALPERERRGLVSSQDAGSTLVMVMPSEGSCLHVLDGRAPEYSHLDEDRTFRVGPHSDLSRVRVDADPRIPPAALFGPEPERGWCYYYQAASLARQRGDWAEVARLGDEAAQRDLRPLDRVEWMPFVQAYAYLGRDADAARLVPILSDVPFLRAQACRLFSEDGAGYGEAHPEGQQALVDAFCE